MQNAKPLVAALPKIICCLIAFPALLRSIFSIVGRREGNPISTSSTNWHPQHSGCTAMKAGLCRPACQSRNIPRGAGICHRLCASLGTQLLLQQKEIKTERWERSRSGGLKSRNMLLSQHCWKSKRKNVHSHPRGKIFERCHKRMTGQIRKSSGGR